MRPPSLRRRTTAAALLAQLVIGQAGALGFHLPLRRVVGVIEPAPDDWTSGSIVGVFAVAGVLFGLSGALAGACRERLGPRKSGLVAAIAISSGSLVAALGVFLHEIGLLYLGYGVLGGAGLGLGLTTSLALLLRSFPERRGLAIGLALLALGLGVLLASPLTAASIHRFASLASAGVWETLVVLGSVYALALITGALLF